ncbi:MAG TPA: DNA-processing protein DprA [Anaerolineales bacterium]
MIDPKAYWVGFNLVKGIGAVRLRNLIQHFGDVETAWHASPQEMRAAGLGPKLIETMQQVRAGVSLELVWERVHSLGIQVLTWEDEAYPRRLKEIDQPPPVLYLRDNLQPEDEWAVAIVGTRGITAYGRQVTAEIASVLARRGVTVISGLARGIDAEAHKAALNAGGRTLAVLGSGVDQIYPPEHRQLADQIIASGALMSDYAPGTPPDGVNFPPRNRIISGLSMAVIVIEAGERSGALITAEFAADQGREVFAVPGNINAPKSVGCNRLIHQGARPLLTPEDVLESLDLASFQQQRVARAVLPKDEVEARLLSVLTREPMHVDDIRARVDMPIEKVSATLALMELKGMVRQLGGMNFVAIREEAEDYIIK